MRRIVVDLPEETYLLLEGEAMNHRRTVEEQAAASIRRDLDIWRPGYHGEGALADFDPGTGYSVVDDWLKD
jgi:hypothetical protein